MGSSDTALTGIWSSTGFRMLISGEVPDELLDLLSDATLGIIGDLNDHIGGLGLPKQFVLV